MLALLAGCSLGVSDSPDRPLRREPLVADLGKGVTFDFVWIPAGRFTMGGGQSDLPRREATIQRGFYLGQCEVTQEQWTAVMGTNPSLNKGPKLPVERVDWDDLQAFLSKLNRRFASKKLKFMLPTEAQWEYACRAGASSRSETTDNKDLLPRYAWIGSNSNYESRPVGKRQPNAWGLYDMQGNVAEWSPTCSMRTASRSGRFRATPSTPWSRRQLARGGESQCMSTSPRSAAAPSRCVSTVCVWSVLQWISAVSGRAHAMRVSRAPANYCFWPRRSAISIGRWWRFSSRC